MKTTRQQQDNKKFIASAREMVLLNSKRLQINFFGNMIYETVGSISCSYEYQLCRIHF